MYDIQYFNAGLKFLQYLAIADLFKNYYGLEPGVSQMYTNIIMIPWTTKLLYGIISDTVPICGSRKRSWIIQRNEAMLALSSSAK